MCGVIGIVSDKENASLSIYNGLTVLQHRGQDAAGMAVSDKTDRLKLHKDNGLVRDVFQNNQMQKMMGSTYGIGHNRYPTAGCSDSEEAQPFYVNSPCGLSLVHNGNLVNTEKLKQELIMKDLRHVNTTSDSEIILNIYAKALHGKIQKGLTADRILEAVDEVHNRVDGGYAVIIMIVGHGLLAFRDPNGIRPLMYGKKNNKQHMIASENVAHNCLGYNKSLEDIKPGQAIFINLNGEVFKSIYSKEAAFNPCIFEYVYLARPDSTINSVNVYKSRLNMGTSLANKIKKTFSKEDLNSIDVVIPIPDTSRTSALPLSLELKIKLREGFVKNRYIGRTFIMPGQKIRKKSVRQKLNTINSEFKDKNVLLIDDSIVRGNTSKQIVQMAREAGAKKVFFASASPPIRHPNVYGIDMPYVEELVAYNKTVEEICQAIGADKLIYQDLDDLIASVQSLNKSIKSFDASCFSGQYITVGVNKKYLSNLKFSR